MLHSPNASFAPMLNQAPKVLMAVCTYKRPKMLDACLASLIGQEPDYTYTPAILVVDNDQAKSAHQPFCRVSRATHSLDMHYICEPHRGIARARNAALRFAREHGFQHLAFIDDDEIADSNWLSGLMHPAYLTVPFLAGRNYINYGDAPAWARPFKPLSRIEGERINHAGTGNVRLGPSILARPLWFDASLGLGGGEDTDFFRRARLQYGLHGKITNRAITHEAAHPERLTMWGQSYRTFWYTATNFKFDARSEGRAHLTLRKLPTVIGSIPGGLFHICIGLLKWRGLRRNEVKGKRKILKGCKMIAKGQGYLAGMVGHIPQAYVKTVGG